MPTVESPGEHDAVEVPLYTYLDAVRFLRVPIWTALSFSPQRRLHPLQFEERFWREPRSRARFADDYGPTLRGDELERISFRSLASLFVISSLLRPLIEDLPYREIDYLIVDVSHEAVRRNVNDPRLFTESEWVLGLFDRIIDRAPALDRGSLLKLIALHQARVEVKEGIPVRFFPFSRAPAPDAPRAVVIDPELRFGRPTVKGAPTDVLAERWRAGDSAADLAEDYGLTVPEAEEALRYEVAPFHPLSFFPLLPTG
ncbi:MAG: DUF433 domain-containing protein [Gemmataceae bacterium]